MLFIGTTMHLKMLQLNRIAIILPKNMEITMPDLLNLYKQSHSLNTIFKNHQGNVIESNFIDDL